MKKTYSLVVYLTDDDTKVAYAIAEKSFTDLWEMIEFCAAFITDEYEFLFDVWTEEDGQVNINQGVELYRAAMKQMENDFH